LSALIVSSFGAILTWGRDTITRELDDVIGPMIKKMYGEEVAQDFTDMASGILQLTSNVYTLCFIFLFFGFCPFGFILFILGLVSLAICLFGFCGACCKSILCLRVVCLKLII
ncbi:uncharacterized protein DC041_0010911, partial [Schistosoma bovis]